MQFTLLILAVSFLAAASAGHHYEDFGPASYKFEYGVADPHTGDKKSQYEHRDGHVVKGAYSLKEADGTTRLVEYVADPHSGFNAVVKKIGHAHHPAHYGGGYGGVGGGYGGLGGGYGGLAGGHGGYGSGYGLGGGYGGHGYAGLGHGGYGGAAGLGHGGGSYVGATHWGFNNHY